jgi:hypothetical protein
VCLVTSPFHPSRFRGIVSTREYGCCYCSRCSGEELSTAVTLPPWSTPVLDGGFVLVRFRLSFNAIRVYCCRCGSTAVVTHAVRGNNNAPQRSILPRHRAGYDRFLGTKYCGTRCPAPCGTHPAIVPRYGRQRRYEFVRSWDRFWASSGRYRDGRLPARRAARCERLRERRFQVQDSLGRGSWCFHLVVRVRWLVEESG